MNLHSHSISSLQGVLTVPGDKSISHRAAILGGLAQGVTEVDNFLCSEDCLNTLRAMEQLGAKVDVLEERQGYGPVRFRITGVAMSPKAPGTAHRLRQFRYGHEAAGRDAGRLPL